MIESFPSYGANDERIFEALAGEKIKATLPNCTGSGGENWFTLFLFESGYSLTMHHKGGFWINGKNETRTILQEQRDQASKDHDIYEKILALLS